MEKFEQITYADELGNLVTKELTPEQLRINEIIDIVNTLVDKQKAQLEVQKVLDWKEQLKLHTLSNIEALQDLRRFMETSDFYILKRGDKNLLYDQLAMLTGYVKSLGEFCEIKMIDLRDRREK